MVIDQIRGTRLKSDEVTHLSKPDTLSGNQKPTGKITYNLR